MKYAPRSDDEVFEALKEWRYTTQLGKLIETFLAHFKSNQLDLAELQKRAASSGDVERARLFVDVFSFFYDRYETSLSRKENEIDFIEVDVIISEKRL